MKLHLINTTPPGSRRTGSLPCLVTAAGMNKLWEERLVKHKPVPIAVLGIEKSKTGKSKFFIYASAWEDWPVGEYALWASPPKHEVSKKCWCKPEVLAKKKAPR